MSNNNNCLVELDPDHNISENGTVKKCSNYDTSLEFNKTFSSKNNISILYCFIPHWSRVDIAHCYIWRVFL